MTTKVTKFLGHHIKGSSGLLHTLEASKCVGARSVSLHVTSNQRYHVPYLDTSTVDSFKHTVRSAGVAYLLPHASYFINLGNPNPDKRRFACKMFLRELQQCERLGIALYNFHPGSTIGACPREESITYIAQAINQAHKSTSRVLCLLENMAGQGNVIGSTIDELAAIIGQVEDQNRIGICLDTCHAFAAGYDVGSVEGYEALLGDIESKIGMKYLRAVHLNDSKDPLGSRRDRHAAINRGMIDPSLWQRFMNDPRFNYMPIVIESPGTIASWKAELAFLYSLVETQG